MFYQDQPILAIEAASKDTFRIDCKEDGELPEEHRGLRRRRVSRWDRGNVASAASSLSFPDHFPSTLPSEVVSAMSLRLRLNETTAVLTGEEPVPIPRSQPERSPSPKPTYDDTGKRNNTREQRKRTALQRERQYVVDDAIKLNPRFRPPPDFKPIQLKKTTKLYVPEKEYPDYNFIGIIIGPRGITQQELEAETGAKIAIRGKGSTKDGRNLRKQEGADEDLHVLITADTDAQMDAAVKRVQELLIPKAEGKNEIKRNQLRKLAELNGTLTIRERPPPSHLHQQQHHDSSNIRCARCGDHSHPTIDCPLSSDSDPKNDSALDPALASAFEEYMAALQEEVDQQTSDPSLNYPSHPSSHPSSNSHPPPPLPPSSSDQTSNSQSSPNQQNQDLDEIPPWLQ